MPINFHCTKCKGLLSVPEEIAGRSAQCPRCQEVQTVPDESVSTTFSEEQQSEEMPPFLRQTPPAKLFQDESSEPFTSGIRFTELFGTTWRIYTKTIGKQLLLGLIAWMLYLTTALFVYIITSLPSLAFLLPLPMQQEMQKLEQAIERQQQRVEIVKSEKEDVVEKGKSEAPEQMTPNVALEEKDATIEENAGIMLADSFQSLAYIFAGLLLFCMLFLLISFWLYAGQVRFMLNLVRGNDPSLGMIFSGWSFLGRFVYIAVYVGITIMLVYMVVFVVAMLTGIFSLLVPDGEPGIVFQFLALVVSWFVATLYCLSYFFVVDRENIAGESLRLSRRHVVNHLGVVLGTMFVLAFITYIAAMTPFGFVQLFTTPFVVCLTSVLYLKITGQPSAE